MAQPLKRQLEIAGAERPSIEEVDQRVAAYVAVMYERRHLAEQESHLKSMLLEVLNEHDLDDYVYADGDYRYLVKRSTAQKVKCKREALDDDADFDPDFGE